VGIGLLRWSEVRIIVPAAIARRLVRAWNGSCPADIRTPSVPGCRERHYWQDRFREIVASEKRSIYGFPQIRPRVLSFDIRIAYVFTRNVCWAAYFGACFRVHEYRASQG
jgi:hypothetical protein